MVRGQELPTAYVHAKFEDRSFTRLRNIEGVPKFRNWVTYPRPRKLRGQFVVRGQELPTAYVRAKFEDKCVSKTDISPYAQLIPGGVVHGPLKGTNISATSVSTQVIFGVDLLTFRPDIAYKRPNCEKNTKLYQLCFGQDRSMWRTLRPSAGQAQQ